MLDCMIFKGDRFEDTGILDSRPFFKPSSKSIPLHQSSAHPAGVHNWPLTEISRIYNISSCFADFKIGRKVLIDRYRTFFLDAETTSACNAWRPNLFRRDRGSVAPERVIRCVLDFHPLLARAGLNGIIKTIWDLYTPILRHIWRETPTVQVAWKCCSLTTALGDITRRLRF